MLYFCIIVFYKQFGRFLMNIFNIENKIFCIRIELFDLCLIYEISVL